MTWGGMIPVGGMAFDAINAIWYAAEGDWTNFGWSGLASIPGVGYFSQGVKYGIKAVSRLDDASDVIKVAKSAGKQLNKGTGNAVIGKMDDLTMSGTIKKGEYTIAEKLPNLGDPKANWKQNSSVLRQEMNRGVPIRDASVNAATGKLENNTGFLRMERNLLENHGWKYDPVTHYWYPPGY